MDSVIIFLRFELCFIILPLFLCPALFDTYNISFSFLALCSNNTLMGASPVHLFAMAVDAEATPQYIYIDGERVSLDDERILNVVTVKPTIKPMQAGIGLFAATSDKAPNVT